MPQNIMQIYSKNKSCTIVWGIIITDSSSDESEVNMCLSDSDSVISITDGNDSINFNSGTLLDTDILKCKDFVIVKFPQKDYDINFNVY